MPSQPQPPLKAILSSERPDLRHLDEYQLLELSIEALSEEKLTPQEYEKTFEAIFLADVSRDWSIIHNLGMLAAKAGLEKEAMAFALDTFEEPHYFTTFVICKTYLEHGPISDRDGFDRLLNDLVKVGYFKAKFYVFDQNLKGLSVFRLPLSVLYRLSHLPSLIAVVMRDMNDPRLESKLGFKKSSRAKK